MTTPSITKFILSITKFLTCSTPSKSQRLTDAEFWHLHLLLPGNEKGGQYSDYSPEKRLKIARYAIENGNSAAARHFSRALNESTVQGLKISYLKLKKSTDEMKTLPKSPRGGP